MVDKLRLRRGLKGLTLRTLMFGMFPGSRRVFAVVPLARITVLSVWGCALVPTFAAEKFDAFTIQQTRGSSCEVKPSGNPDWKTAKEGETYKAGAGGRTGGQSTLTVAFDDDNRFRLLPKTEVVIRVSTRDARFRKVIELSMDKGNVEVDLDAFPKGYQLKVQTPTAVCGAVGTRFSVESKSRQENAFRCGKGTISARSREDGSFDAPEIGEGRVLKAEALPGKENSHTRLTAEGGAIAVSVGSKDNKLNVQDGSVLHLAQETAASVKQVVIRVDRGGINDSGKGRYFMDGGSLRDVSQNDKAAGLVDDYIDRSRIEGNCKADLKQAKAQGGSPDKLSEMQSRVDKAAAKASAVRTQLRDVINMIKTVGTGAISTGATRDQGRTGADPDARRPERVDVRPPTDAIHPPNLQRPPTGGGGGDSHPPHQPPPSPPCPP